jgi:hypothetical protein
MLLLGKMHASVDRVAYRILAKSPLEVLREAGDGFFPIQGGNEQKVTK